MIENNITIAKNANNNVLKIYLLPIVIDLQKFMEINIVKWVFTALLSNLLISNVTGWKQEYYLMVLKWISYLISIWSANKI